MYTPKKTRDYEELVGQACWTAMQAQGVSQVENTPLEMNVLFRFPVPKSAIDRVGQYHLLDPDLTNLLKAVEDGCQGVLYKNDNCIARSNGAKWWDVRGSIFVEFMWYERGRKGAQDDYERTDALYEGRDVF
jgi:Holliday junction resolvase RusA-like endonuclease